MPDSVEQVVPERKTRLLILLICSMSLLIVGLDTTIVNVALPAIHRSFHASLSQLQWTIDAYTLVLASLLMLSGSTADRLGRKRVFQIGLALFSLGSLLCALAPNLGMLIAARALQAIGGSMLNPVAMSIIRNVFVDPKERAQAIGVWGSVIGISLALGPVVGGALVDSVGWPAVFLVNLPIGIAAIVLTARYVPESRADHPRRIDPVGQVLVIVALATLTYAIIEGPKARLAVGAHADPGRGRGGRRRRADPLRAAPRRAADRGPVLPQRAVLGRQRDRRVRVHGARRLPVPQHPVPAGRPRACRRLTPACTRCRWRWSRSWSRRCRAGWSAAAARAHRWSAAASPWPRRR